MIKWKNIWPRKKVNGPPKYIGPGKIYGPNEKYT